MVADFLISESFVLAAVCVGKDVPINSNKTNVFLCSATFYLYMHQSVSQFSHSVVSDSCLPMDCSMLGLPVHHQLPEFT